ncbi:MAG: hypothetical protein IPJ41_09610 [Phycisphaerales bacterium]|nr:hypothetical protein [Phycisphaerales bacterium]
MARKARARVAEQTEEGRFGGMNLRVAAAALLALIGVSALGYGSVVVHARATEILAAEPIRVVIEWPTQPGSDQTWLDEGLRDQITSRVEAQLTGRRLDATLMDQLGNALASSGWFDGAPRLDRTADDVVRVRGQWRAPACALRSGPRDYALDWKGRPFPVDYPAGASGLRVILGAASPVPLSPSGNLDVLDPWPGDDVAAALGLLAPLLREGFASQIMGIDVSDYLSRGKLSIVTDTGSQVVWGGRYGEYIPGEASSEAKIARLRSLASNPQFHHRIDVGQNRIEIFDERYFAYDLTQHQ